VVSVAAVSVGFRFSPTSGSGLAIVLGETHGPYPEIHDIVEMNLVRGENACVYDDGGKRYVDFESGCWSTALGYGYPRVNQVMKAQIDRSSISERAIPTHWLRPQRSMSWESLESLTANVSF